MYESDGILPKFSEIFRDERVDVDICLHGESSHKCNTNCGFVIYVLQQNGLRYLIDLIGFIIGGT